MSKPTLKGWVSFLQLPDGDYFMSDSYKSEREARAAYGNAEIDGYINLALIPPEAIKRVKP